jgi:hypothetical protein
VYDMDACPCRKGSAPQKTNLQVWRDRFRAGGAAALHGRDRPPKVVETAPAAVESWAVPDALATAQRRIAELERKMVSSNWSSIFSSEPCGKSASSAGRATGPAPCRLRAHRSDDDTAAASRIAGRAPVRAGRRQPRRRLPALAGLGTAPGGNRGARCDPACRAGASPLRLPADRRAAPPRGDGGQSQAGAAADARRQSVAPACCACANGPSCR